MIDLIIAKSISISNKNYLLSYSSIQIYWCQVKCIFSDRDCFLLVPRLRKDVITSRNDEVISVDRLRLTRHWPL